MAKREIEWSPQASINLVEILEFYRLRNGNASYSRKLLNEIDKSVRNIQKHNYIGKLTDEDSVRVVIQGNYEIFYSLNDTFRILHIWDSRQNPAHLSV